MIARIVEVERIGSGQDFVSYELLDDDGYVIERVMQATLDEGWWRSFQPLTRRCG
jgi:hypothetical protein